MKEERLFSWKQILAVLLLAGLFYTVTGEEGLARWTRDREDPRARFLFSRLLAPFRAAGQATGIPAEARQLKENFHLLKDRSFGEWERLGFTMPVRTSLPGEGPEKTEKPEAAGLPGDPSQTSRPGTTAGGGLAASGTPPAVPVPAETAGTGQALLQTGGGISLAGFTAAPELFPAASPPPLREEKLVLPPPPPGPPSGTLLLIGDSLANSCSTALFPIAETLPDLTVEKYGRVSANLSNPVFDGWFGEIDQFLAGRHFDTVLIMMGANAAQAITRGEERFEYGTPEWELLYRERAAAFIAKLKGEGSRVAWVGIPPMFKKTYRENMLRQNELLKGVCRDNGILFYPIQFIIGDDEGLYTDYKVIGGRQVRIRSSDRIHYTQAGADLLTRYLLGELFPGNIFTGD